MKKRTLITGLSGLLGNNLAYCLKDAYDILGVYHTHRVEMDGIRTVSADLTRGEGLFKVIKEFDPEIVIHCAAQANVDTCEDYQLEAEKINVLGTKYLIQGIKSDATKVIYISSDLVYDGVKGHFSEDDIAHPLNFYGETKYKGELEALRRRNSLILRTNFFGWNILEDKYSLGEWVIHELSQRNEIKGFTDCRFSSIYTFELTKILDLAIQKNLSGIYNCASSTSLSKYDFLLNIASRLDLAKRLIKPICVDASGLRAKRSKNLNLDVSKLAAALSINIPSIEQSIEQFVEDFQKGVPGIIQSYRCQKNIYPASLGLIPYGRQSIDDDDILAVEGVLRSDTITQGARVNEFESALCEATDATYAVAVNSGTSALHIACLAAGIAPGDEVITSPNTFVASANCVVYCGGKPVFADIHPRTYSLSPQEIEKKINERTKAVIPVHFAGQSCDMESIQNIVKINEKKYGHKIYIIEDASHALGSCYKTKRVGACTFSDMTTMSFHPVKHVTTGEGGVVLTNDKALKRKLSLFRSHGITNDPEELLYRENVFERIDGCDDKSMRKLWYYEQQFLGYNYRITDILCALGISQLKKLRKFSEKRREIVNQYNDAFKGVEGLTTPYEEDFCDSNFHLYVLRFDFKEIGISRAQLMAELKKKGIQTQVHYIPVHTQPFYRNNFGTNWGDCPAAEHYYEQCLSVPLYPQLTPRDMDKVISSIKQIIVGSKASCLGKQII